MASLYSTFHVRPIGDDPDMSLVFGRPVEPGLYSLPFPPVDCSTELAIVKHAKGSPAPAHWRMVRALASHVKRPHRVMPASYDADGHGRRLESLRAFLRDVPEAGCEENVARAIVAHVAEYALGALGLRREHALPGDVEDALCKLLPRRDVRASFEATTHSAYPSNSIGAGIDRQITAEREERARAIEAEETKRVEAAKPCTMTLDEMNVIGIRVRHGEDVPALLSEAFRVSQPNGASDDEHVYVFIPRASLLGASVPTTRIGTGEILAGDHVPPLPAKAVVPMSDVGARRWCMFHARRRTRPVVAGTFDYSTAEGRARISQMVGAVEASGLLAVAFPTTVLGGDACPSVDAMAMLVSAARDGFSLAHDIAALELSRILASAWEKRHERARREHEGREPYQLPRCPWSEERLAEMMATTPALYTESELYVHDEGFVTGLLAKIGLDPWRATLETITADVIRSSEVERLLTDAGHLKGQASPKDLVRIHGLMTRLGFKKRDAVIEGQRVKAFVKGGDHGS